MKKLVYLSFVFLGIGFANLAQAQINVNINIGSQPLWGPVGYDYARYYYMPEIDVYYDVIHRRYTYFQGNRWITKSKLPGRYRNHNLFRTYKVVINDSNPWRSHRIHRNSYARYQHNYSQSVLRDSRNHRSDYRRDRNDRYHRADRHVNRGREERHESKGKFDRKKDNRGHKKGHNR